MSDTEAWTTLVEMVHAQAKNRGDAIAYESAGETYVTGIWEGGEANTGPAISVPEGFGELVQRKADLFDTLLALLKEPAQPMGLSHDDFERWLRRALATIARAEAIIADHEMQAKRS